MLSELNKLPIAILVGITTFFLGWGLGFGRQKILERQNQGEARVRELLTSVLKDQSTHLMNNVTLQVEDGTTQIDHILVSRAGIFVIETKSYQGWIYANANESQWIQVLFRTRFRFQNPIRQNYKHVVAIRALLDFLPREHIHSIVVFTENATFKTERPKGVFLLDELSEWLLQQSTEVMTENKLQFCVGRLECQRRAITNQTDIEHAEYLYRKYQTD